MFLTALQLLYTCTKCIVTLIRLLCYLFYLSACFFQSSQKPADRDAEDSEAARGRENCQQAVHAVFTHPEGVDCGGPAADRGPGSHF